MEFRGSQHDEVEHAHAASLEDQSVGTTPQPHTKSEGHHQESRDGGTRQAHLQGQQAEVNRVAEEQAEPHEEEEHARADPDVPLGDQPGEEAGPRDGDGAGLAGGRSAVAGVVGTVETVGMEGRCGGNGEFLDGGLFRRLPEGF